MAETIQVNGHPQYYIQVYPHVTALKDTFTHIDLVKDFEGFNPKIS